MIDHWSDWASKCASILDGDIGYVDQALTAYSHGSFSDRYYTQRHALIKDFVPEEDISASQGQPWQWSSEKPSLHEGVANYFLDRREDGGSNENAG